MPERALPPGHLAIDGCVNFRDAGGWATADGQRMRTGRVFRSDDPIRTRPAGREAVLALGLSLVVDLRQPVQVERSPGFLPPERTLLCPLVDRVLDLDDPPPMTEPSHMTDLYEDMLGRSREALALVLDDIADKLPDGPVLVHCAYGKDRTGLVVAVIQAALGIPADAIVEEYHRSDAPTHRRYQWLVDEPLPDDVPIGRAPRFLFSAPAETMTLLLERVQTRHGSLVAWAESLPVRPDTFDRLRALLLEPAPA
jgi:hypothetical protein